MNLSRETSPQSPKSYPITNDKCHHSLHFCKSCSFCKNLGQVQKVFRVFSWQTFLRAFCLFLAVLQALSTYYVLSGSSSFSTGFQPVLSQRQCFHLLFHFDDFWSHFINEINGLAAKFCLGFSL